MLTSADLARIRSDLELLMPDTCTILNVTHTSDGQGGYTDSYGTASANVKCRLDAAQNRQAGEQLAAGAISPFNFWILTLPHGTAISVEQLVVVGAGTFNVQSVDSGKSWSGCVRCTLGKL